MVTAEEWTRLLEAYSAAIWPAQIIIYAISIVVSVCFIFQPQKRCNNTLKLYFALTFAWNGVMWFFIHGREVDGTGYGNFFIGVTFLLIAARFFRDLNKQKMIAKLPAARSIRLSILGLLLIVWSYPLLGWAFGHNINRWLFPGTFPCPTLALAILYLVLTLPNVDHVIFIPILLLAIPPAIFIQITKYRVYEDLVLLVCGFFGLYIYLRTKAVKR